MAHPAQIEEEIFQSMYEISRARLNDVGALPLRYVANMMMNFNPDEMFEGGKLKPMGPALHRAMDAEGLEQIRALRKVGDTVLLRSAIWPESIERAVPPRYFRSLGEAAYITVSDKKQEQGEYGRQQGTFYELASKFNAVVDVIAEFRGWKPEDDLNNLLREGRKTDSPLVHEMLGKHGISIIGAGQKIPGQGAQADGETSQAVSRLILDWRASGNPETEKKIRDMGVIPLFGKKGPGLQ